VADGGGKKWPDILTKYCTRLFIASIFEFQKKLAGTLGGKDHPVDSKLPDHALHGPGPSRKKPCCNGGKKAAGIIYTSVARHVNIFLVLVLSTFPMESASLMILLLFVGYTCKSRPWHFLPSITEKKWQP
jgi:hypothetical protein